ncbi:MAG: acyltransferase [Pseudolysinimonas sp.]
MTIHASADVAASAVIPDSAKIWHYAQVRDDARLGENCIIGRGAYIGTGVVMGDNCKVQNYALVYEPARLGAGVFIGPAAVLTNDQFPRAVAPDGSLKSADDWHAVGVEIGDGASIGANATCIAPVVIGRWALVGSGSVVVKNVPDYALVVGNPAKRIGWVGDAAAPLVADGDRWRCPQTSRTYREAAPDQLVPEEDA